MAPRPKHQNLSGLATRFLIAFALSVPSILAAQEMPVPVRDQYPILLKALTFDRNLRSRCADTVVLGVLYQSRNRQSEETKTAFVAAGRKFASYLVDELPIRIIPIDLSGDTDLDAEIPAHRINTLYVTPLHRMDMRTITAVTRKAKVLTLTGVPAYVESGLSIGVALKDQRPSLVINRRAFRAEGADLDSQLLELVRIIR